MYEDYLKDACDIYHVREETVNAGYGIPPQTELNWQDAPDLTDVPCHFHVRNGTLQWEQREPDTDIDGIVKLSLLPGTDIRRNDIVVSKGSESIEAGLRFRAAIPRTVHGNHHIIVELYREDGLKGAV